MRIDLIGFVAAWATVASAAFTGMGQVDNRPACCYACRASIASATLTCSEPMHHGHGHGHHMAMTSADCYAEDDSFLTTLAHCIDAKCSDEQLWELEKYWAESTTGDPFVPPKWDFRTALEQIEEPPQRVLGMHDTLNFTALVDPETYGMNERFNYSFPITSKWIFAYSIIILVVGFATPIILTALSHFPGVAPLIDRIKPYILYPSTVGTYHVRPLPWQLGNAPTIGQALFVFAYFILNFVLSAVNYIIVEPHPWGYNRHQEIMAYVGYRTGEIGYAILPLVILFAGRNNVLLYVTNWSHATYMLLHRWIARIFAAQAIIHSILLLAAYKGNGILATNETQPYYVWGIVGTLLTCIMLVVNLLWLRRWTYEVFLLMHILMVLLLIVACWYHVILRFGRTNQHELWLFAAIAVWVFDRVLRILRVCNNGRCRAKITEIGTDHIRIDIIGIRWASNPALHAYAYFPTLNWRPWENHPFSVNPTMLFAETRWAEAATRSSGEGDGSSSDNAEVEKASGKNVVSSTHNITADPEPALRGLTLFVKKNKGTTRLLAQHANLLTLVEGPYRKYTPNKILQCDRVLLIGGGIGITGLMSYVPAHANVKLAWSVKQSAEPLVQHLDPFLRKVVDRDVRVGSRVDVESLLKEEVTVGWKRIGVVVCGPGGLCDDVRAAVVRMGRKGGVVFELETDTFSW